MPRKDKLAPTETPVAPKANQATTKKVTKAMPSRNTSLAGATRKAQKSRSTVRVVAPKAAAKQAAGSPRTTRAQLLAHKNANPKNKSGVNQLPNTPDWDEWRQCATGRIWMVVLLTMNIDPTPANRQKLKDTDPKRWREYETRKKVVYRNLGVHLHLFPSVNDGQNKSEKSLGLADLYAFALKSGWRGLDPMNRALWNGSGPPQSVYLRTQSNPRSTSSNEKRSAKSAESNRVNKLIRILACCAYALHEGALESKDSLEELMSRLLTIGEKKHVSVDRGTLRNYLEEAYSLVEEKKMSRTSVV